MRHRCSFSHVLGLGRLGLELCQNRRLHCVNRHSPSQVLDLLARSRLVNFTRHGGYLSMYLQQPRLRCFMTSRPTVCVCLGKLNQYISMQYSLAHILTPATFPQPCEHSKQPPGTSLAPTVKDDEDHQIRDQIASSPTAVWSALLLTVIGPGRYLQRRSDFV